MGEFENIKAERFRFENDRRRRRMVPSRVPGYEWYPAGQANKQQIAHNQQFEQLLTNLAQLDQGLLTQMPSETDATAALDKTTQKLLSLNTANLGPPMMGRCNRAMHLVWAPTNEDSHTWTSLATHSPLTSEIQNSESSRIGFGPSNCL